jgi:hypothetical protein
MMARHIPQECWRIYHGDVHAGMIAQCVGNPGAAPNGNGATASIRAADRASAAAGLPRRLKGRAWTVFLAKRTEADFEAWREEQAWTAENYRRFDRGERMPADWRPSARA